MRLGFEAATRAGLTLGLFDIPHVPADARKKLRADLSPADCERWSARVRDRIQEDLARGLTTPEPNPLSAVHWTVETITPFGTWKVTEPVTVSPWDT